MKTPGEPGPPRDRASAGAWLKARGTQLARLPGRLRGLAVDSRIPLPAKVLVVLLALYLMMPIDLIPDFIPVLGQLDDLVIVAGVVALVARIVPAEVWREHFQVE